MSASSLVPAGGPPAGPLSDLPAVQARQVAGTALAAAIFALLGTWAAPNLALGLTVAAGVAITRPWRIASAPLQAVAITGAGLAADALQVPAILAVGLAAGLVATALLPGPADRLDYVNGALATAISATLGLWVTTRLLAVDGGVISALTSGAILGLFTSLGLLPHAIRWDAVALPSWREVEAALKEAYRPPVRDAFRLYEGIKPGSLDNATRRGLCEVATWVFKLQVTLQSLDAELDAIVPEDIQRRIAAAEADSGEDAFTKERRQATATHLRRLLDHRAAIATERGRNMALVEYATAFLEEARAGLAVARELPGEAVPDRLPDVLGKLRSQAAEGDARRRTRREIEAVGAKG